MMGLPDSVGTAALPAPCFVWIWVQCGTTHEM